MPDVLAVLTRADDDPVGTRALGRLGGCLFLAAGVIVLLTQPLESERDLGSVYLPTLIAGAGLCFAFGVLAFVMPWDRWPRTALLGQSIAALVLLGFPGRFVPEALELYLPLYVVVFLFVGLTQKFRAIPWVTLGAVVVFLASAVGVAGTETYQHFTVTAAVGVLAATVLAAVMAHERRAYQHLDILLAATRDIGRSADVPTAVAVLQDAVAVATGADVVMTFLAERLGSTRFVGIDPDGVPRLVDLDEERGDRPATLGSGDQVFVPDARRDPVSRGLLVPHGIRSCFYSPLFGEDGRLGSLAVGWHHTVHGVDPLAAHAIAILATEAGLALERLRRIERARVEAETDALTGLLNRRAVDRRLRDIIAGDTVLLIDLDEFKSINDRFGHDAGDRMLKTVATCMLRSCRADDWCGRTGGDEFVMMLRGGGHGAADLVVRQLRDTWARRRTGATLSIGIAVHQLGSEPSRTLAHADRALYRAKKAGRDRAVLYDPELDRPFDPDANWPSPRRRQVRD